MEMIFLSFLSDKSVRRFFFGIAAFLVLLFIFDIVIGISVRNEIKSAILENDLKIASALSEAGVPEGVTAAALTGAEVNEKGETLLKKLALTENLKLSLLPGAPKLFAPYVFSAAKFAFLSLFLLFIVTGFLKSRERLYLSASEKIASEKLPCGDEGGIYRLFERVNNMKASLDAMRERESETKEFLKRTVSDISHQLKTPLASLSMYNDIILSEPQNTSAVVEFSEKSAKSVERIKTLILSLLKLTRLDSGSVSLAILPHSALEVISFSIENLSERARSERKSIILPEDDGIVFCDFNWAGEALGNLIKNALDHTSAGGEIKISLEKTPLDARISVSDNGSGIEEEDFHHIFKRFYKSGKATDTEGAGLGLPIVKAVMDGHGGDVFAESERGRGSRFTLIFPSAYKTVR